VLARSIDDVLPELTRAAGEAVRLLEPAAFNDHPAIVELLVEAGLPLPDPEDAPVRMRRLATRSGAAYRLNSLPTLHAFATYSPSFQYPPSGKVKSSGAIFGQSGAPAVTASASAYTATISPK
jgi:hypothetical protein